MKIILHSFILCNLILSNCCPSWGEQPQLIKSEPVNGSQDVSTNIGVIRFYFDQNMKMNSHSLLESDQGGFPPLLKEEENVKWVDPKTFEVKIQTLKSGTTYAIQLNSKSREGFRSAWENEPLPVSVVTFTTAQGKLETEESPRTQGKVETVQGKKPAQVVSSEKGGGQMLTLYREQYQGAFYMLIPQGWKTEGGMIPSGVEWNVVDLVETNIKFRVTSPDGKSFFGWYPRFYFQDPAVMAQSSMGILQMMPGQVMNGCWLFPYMGIRDYVQTIVFGQFAQNEFINPRILGNAVPSPELKPWVPQVASRSEYGYVNFECSINGVPSFGRMYAIVYDLGGLAWTTVGTFGLVAPKERWKEDERLMELCIRSFQLDPQWVAKASAAQRERSKVYGDTIRQMNEIDNQMQQERSQTRSDMQTEFYKVLTDQIETKDPETGDVKWLPSYNHAYSDNKGNYYLSNDEGIPFDNPSEWKKLEIVNRNNPNYRE